MPVLKFNQCDYNCRGNKDKHGSFRVYCRKAEPSCTPLVALAVRGKAPSAAITPLPIKQKPKRFYKSQEYIGVKTKKKEHGEWIESTSIERFQGKPYSRAEWDTIMEYTNERWNLLIDRIQEEVQQAQNRKPVITETYAYSAAKIISTPKAGRKAKPHKGGGELMPISVAPTVTPLTSTESIVLSILTNTPMHIDEITIASQLPPGKVSATLLTLELNGLIKRLPGAYFVRRT